MNMYGHVGVSMCERMYVCEGNVSVCVIVREYLSDSECQWVGELVSM